MIEIDGKIISRDVFEKKFVCDLNACKGACCIEGDGGAPLEEQEIGAIEDGLDAIKPYMRPEGIEAIEKQGIFYVDWDAEPVTTLVDNKECAFVFFDENGITKCAIEKAHAEGKIPFNKPMSCHLYPIRVSKLSVGYALNYHQWPICKPACECGEKLDIKVFRFLKGPLIRKFGPEFYEKMEAADELLHNSSR